MRYSATLPGAVSARDADRLGVGYNTVCKGVQSESLGAKERCKYLVCELRLN